MKRYLALLFGLAGLLLVGWYGYRALVDQQSGFPLPLQIKAEGENKLPVEPDDWQGKIAYRDLDRDFTLLAAQPEMAGLAVAIVEEGELRFIGTYGVSDKSSGRRVMPDTVFRWASVSKGVAGSLAAKLSTEGKLNLNTPLSAWHSSLRLPGGAESQINLAELLSHRTGLTKNAYDTKLEDGQDPGLLRSQLGVAPLQCVPGTCHSYQNIAFDAASEILGQTAGTLYSDAVQKQLFKPLGMKSAQFGMVGLTGAKRWARPHRGDEVRTLSESYWRVPAAAGVSSDIVDMARWLRAQMGENKDVLSDETLALAHAPLVRTRRPYSGDLARALGEPSYGLGWRSFTYAGRQLVGHSGAVDGFRSTLIFDPAAHTGVIAMWNSGWGRPFRLPFAVLDSYYGQSGNKWLNLSDLPPPKVPAAPSSQSNK
ncbi:serine hydrolase domain-containing protein [Sphingorhabdus sp. M41]|uniref:serine hydrolase domain-containing protein n=1 Tax=Sphingorhabdus sp. M41 TaxID=1806885 RepID=UPI00078D6CDC|nr:serine hydrolase domain-containing protein [Sphingorhabdus sp. M41]AMO70807.1 serine hydrolase [Sphingorhabdus sp. M41]